MKRAARVSENAIATVAVVQVWGGFAKWQPWPTEKQKAMVHCRLRSSYIPLSRWTRDGHGLGWIEFFGSFLWFGSVGFNDTVIGRVRRLRALQPCSCSVRFFSRPPSEGWPHHGRTFSIYPCPVSLWLTLLTRTDLEKNAETNVLNHRMSPFSVNCVQLCWRLISKFVDVPVLKPRSILSVESNQNVETKTEKCGVQNSICTSRSQENQWNLLPTCHHVKF